MISLCNINQIQFSATTEDLCEKKEGLEGLQGQFYFDFKILIFFFERVLKRVTCL